jgi:gamma-glutamyltranspeptidase/glutathione hydrolase
MGPPSSGGILVIGLLQTYERMRERLPQAHWLHLWAEASRLVFYDRARLLGDPDFVSVPVDRLVSDDYAAAQAQRVSEKDPLALPNDASPREGTHTTHLSVIDKDGQAVTLTQTINVPFGSGLVVPGTGVLLNDEMDDFYAAGPNAFGLVGNEMNAPAPGKCPLSSMSPTFVFDDQRLVAALGSPGGSSIPSAIAWVIREMVEGQQSGEEAVRSPRVHDRGRAAVRSRDVAGGSLLAEQETAIPDWSCTDGRSRARRLARCFGLSRRRRAVVRRSVRQQVFSPWS